LQGGNEIKSRISCPAKALLSGGYDAGTGLMRDDLRTKGLIPSAQPYSTAPWSYAGTETVSNNVLNVSGDNAIVDWVLVELREEAAPQCTKRV
jgi:hypothetical protein